MTAAQRATKHARTLIQLMMKEMHASLRDPDRLTAEQWDKLFGAKQSMIANLQKLVTTLIALQEVEGVGELEGDRSVPLSTQEIQMLTSWLGESRN